MVLELNLYACFNFLYAPVITGLLYHIISFGNHFLLFRSAQCISSFIFGVRFRAPAFCNGAFPPLSKPCACFRCRANASQFRNQHPHLKQTSYSGWRFIFKSDFQRQLIFVLNGGPPFPSSFIYHPYPRYLRLLLFSWFRDFRSFTCQSLPSPLRLLVNTYSRNKFTFSSPSLYENSGMVLPSPSLPSA